MIFVCRLCMQISMYISHIYIYWPEQVVPVFSEDETLGFEFGSTEHMSAPADVQVSSRSLSLAVPLSLSLSLTLTLSLSLAVPLS
eukprot:COSAG03_NODE_9576_length_709_cov_0.962295_2_plen_84_part_01